MENLSDARRRRPLAARGSVFLPRPERRAGLALAFALGATILLPGCLVGPKYQRPAALAGTNLPAAFGAATGTNDPGWKSAEPSAHLGRGPWWELFRDPELNRLESSATGANQQLAAAAARVQQAQALARISRAGLFPDLSLDPAYSRQRTSANQGQSGHPTGTASTFGSFSVPIQAGWELDLWGRVRRELEAAERRLEATADDREAAKLIIQAEVATDYFALRSLEAESEVLQRSSETYRRSLELTRNRRDGGIGTDLDVAQAEAQLRGTEAEVPPLQLQRLRLNHALATLCGQTATGFSVTPTQWPVAELPVAPSSLPSELLERRPDIAAAERRMAAANAEIGVAQTAFYPRVRLNGAAGFQSIGASTLFDWPSRFWAIGPTLDLPLFTGGRNRAQLANARATYDETVARYRQSVLEAFQEVEDQLAASYLLAVQIEAEQAALTAARRTLEIANNRYRAGLITYLEVAVAQSAALARERAVVQLRGQRYAASAGLIRSIGGGWTGGGA